MTVRELMVALASVDTDILDYEVGVVATIHQGKDTRVISRLRHIVVPENVDVDREMLWLEVGRTETEEGR